MMVFRSLFRCLRRSLERLRLKFSKKPRQERGTQFGADIDIEEALAEQLEIQRRSGRAMSSTASIAAALRQRPREMPVFSTQVDSQSRSQSLGQDDPGVRAAVHEMQSLTPTFAASGSRVESPETVVSTRTVSPVKKVTVKVPPVLETPEHEEEQHEQQAGAETAEKPEKPEKAASLPDRTEPEADPAAKVPVTSKSLDSEPAAADLPPRRSSIFNMRSEWI